LPPLPHTFTAHAATVHWFCDCWVGSHSGRTVCIRVITVRFTHSYQFRVSSVTVDSRLDFPRAASSSRTWLRDYRHRCAPILRTFTHAPVVNLDCAHARGCTARYYTRLRSHTYTVATALHTHSRTRTAGYCTYTDVTATHLPAHLHTRTRSFTPHHWLRLPVGFTVHWFTVWARTAHTRLRLPGSATHLCHAPQFDTVRFCTLRLVHVLPRFTRLFTRYVLHCQFYTARLQLHGLHIRGFYGLRTFCTRWITRTRTAARLPRRLRLLHRTYFVTFFTGCHRTARFTQFTLRTPVYAVALCWLRLRLRLPAHALRAGSVTRWLTTHPHACWLGLRVCARTLRSTVAVTHRFSGLHRRVCTTVAHTTFHTRCGCAVYCTFYRCVYGRVAAFTRTPARTLVRTPCSLLRAPRLRARWVHGLVCTVTVARIHYTRFWFTRTTSYTHTVHRTHARFTVRLRTPGYRLPGFVCYRTAFGWLRLHAVAVAVLRVLVHGLHHCTHVRVAPRLPLGYAATRLHIRYHDTHVHARLRTVCRTGCIALRTGPPRVYRTRVGLLRTLRTRGSTCTLVRLTGSHTTARTAPHTTPRLPMGYRTRWDGYTYTRTRFGSTGCCHTTVHHVTHTLRHALLARCRFGCWLRYGYIVQFTLVYYRCTLRLLRYDLLRLRLGYGSAPRHYVARGLLVTHIHRTTRTPRFTRGSRVYAHAVAHHGLRTVWILRTHATCTRTTFAHTPAPVPGSTCVGCSFAVYGYGSTVAFVSTPRALHRTPHRYGYTPALRLRFPRSHYTTTLRTPYTVTPGFTHGLGFYRSRSATHTGSGHLLHCPYYTHTHGGLLVTHYGSHTRLRYVGSRFGSVLVTVRHGSHGYRSPRSHTCPFTGPGFCTVCSLRAVG